MLRQIDVFPQGELLRFIRGADGEVRPDPEGEGRGARRLPLPGAGMRRGRPARLRSLVQSAGDTETRDPRLNTGMAKKRVHEIAKEKGIPSKEVLAILQKAGFDVKAAASSVDEDDIATAFNGGAQEPAPEGPPRTAPGREAAPQAGADGSQQAAPQQAAQSRPDPAPHARRPGRRGQHPEEGVAAVAAAAAWSSIPRRPGATARRPRRSSRPGAAGAGGARRGSSPTSRRRTRVRRRTRS